MKDVMNVIFVGSCLKLLKPNISIAEGEVIFIYGVVVVVFGTFIIDEFDS